MAKRTLIYTGSTGLNRMLNALENNLAKKLFRSALRAGAKIVHKEAKTTSPKRSGALRSSLAVRALRRKKDRMGYIVEQKEGPFKGKQFYGSFVEWGWKTGDRRARTYWKVGSTLADTLQRSGIAVKELDSTGGWVRKWQRSRPAEVLEERKDDSRTNNRRQIPGTKFMDLAGKHKEQEAIDRYFDELERLLKTEATNSGNT